MPVSIIGISKNWLFNGRSSSNFIGLGINYSFSNMTYLPGNGPNGEDYFVTMRTAIGFYERFDTVWSFTSNTSGTYNISNWNINTTLYTHNHNDVLDLFVDAGFQGASQFVDIFIRSIEMNFSPYASNSIIKFNESLTLPSSTTLNGYNTPTQWTAGGINFTIGSSFLPSNNTSLLTNTWIINFLPVLVKITYNITLNQNGGGGGSYNSSTYQIDTQNQTRTATLPTRTSYSFTGWTLTEDVSSTGVNNNSAWGYAGGGNAGDTTYTYFADVSFGSSCSGAISGLQFDEVITWLNQNYPPTNYSGGQHYVSVYIKPFNGSSTCAFARYTYIAFEGAYFSPNNTTLNIKTNTYGSFTTTANWNFNTGVEYDITKNAATGTTIDVVSTYLTSNSNQTKTVTITASTGYVLAGASITRTGTPIGGPSPSIVYSESSSTWNLSIFAQSFGDIRVNTTSNLINYTISYVLNGGSGAHGNPTSYNIESTVTLVQGSMTRTGYTFGGWFSDVALTNQVTSFSSETGNKTFYAKWNVINYDISYTLSGSTAYPITNNGHGNPTTYDIEYDIITFVQGNLARAGWAFSAWSPASITAGSTGNKSTTASWTANEYTISLANNGGTGIAINDNTYESSDNNGSAITRTLTRPTRAGWTFNSYSISRTGTFGGTAPSISVNTLTIPSGSYGPMTITANWTGNTGNTITFTGAVIASQTWTTSNASQDKTFTIPAKTGYRINTVSITVQSQGVNSSVSYEDYDGTITIPANAYGSITVNITYVANTYTITFDSQDGSAVNDIAATYDVAIGTLETPTLLGYNFVGWFTAASGGTQIISTSKNLTSVHENTVTLYAQWSPKQLTIIYNSGTGTGTMTNSTGFYNDYVLVKTNTFTKTGYSFSNWLSSDTEADITEPVQNTTYAVVELSSTIGTTTDSAVSITLTAQWTINQYTVTFNSNGGSAVDSITEDYDTSIAEPTDPTLTGYTFEGWYYDVALTNAVTFPFNLPANNLTLYAKWSGLTYNITFIENGGSTITDLSYVVGVNSQDKTLTPGTKTVAHKKHTFNSWEITVQSSGSNSSISGNTLTIPANAYGDIEIQARWNVAERAVYIGSKRLEEDKIRVDAAGLIITKVIITDGDINETVIYDKTLELEDV
jgi:uncharacterized repeat protein (TIGR02543 family)